MTFTLFLLEILLCLGNVLYVYALIQSLPRHEHARATFHGMLLVVMIRIFTHFALDLIAPLAQEWIIVADKSWLLVEVIMLLVCLALIAKSVWNFVLGHHRGQLHFDGRFSLAPQYGTVMWQLFVVSILFSLESATLMISSDLEKSFISVVCGLLALVIAIALSRPIHESDLMKSEMRRVFITFSLVVITLMIIETTHNVLVLDLIYITACFLLINHLLKKRYRAAGAVTTKYPGNG